jgi:centromere/kinetochore protein ZW10
LELFLAVVPSKFSSVIDTVPRMGAVFYNDCVYICHNCTLMTHLYRQDLGKVDPSLKDTVGFIDYIPRLRALGEQSLCVHLEEQKKALLELLSRVHLSMNHESNDRGAAGGDVGDVSNDVAAAGALVKHVERLHGQWYNVLQETVYSRLASHLVETVIRGAMKPVLECDYISEKSGADVSRVFRTLFKLRSAFPEDMQSDAEMCKCVASWGKFLAITDLLEYTLSDIAEALPKRKFSSFTGTEMTLLIKALFEDSSRRQAILTSILDMSTAS